MSAPKTPTSAEPAPLPVLPRFPTWKIYLAGFIIFLAGLAVYSNCFHGPFVLDDLPAIAENRTITKSWQDAWHPPSDGQTVTGRPLVNESFFVNYQWAKAHQADGFAVEGYHVISLAIHLLAGLALFGLVRRTLELPKLRARFEEQSLPLAFMTALLWTVHPLQTESVTYISQRAEAMMGLFFLLTLYFFVRGVSSRWSWFWQLLSVLACLLGAFCKEVTVTAPAIVLLFDGLFVATKPIDLLRKRWPLYLGLLGVALFVCWQARQVGTRGSSAGFGAGVTILDYALSQYPAIVDYLWLSVWPHPLVLDYGQGLVSNLAAAAPAMLLIMALVAGTIYALWRRPLLGFLGAWFFIILAPSSSVVPIVTETMAEHRMYLPLAALTALVAYGLGVLFGKRAVVASVVLALVLGSLTFERNIDYRTTQSIWRDATAKHPDIARAHENYGIMLFNVNRMQESVQEYETALRLRPDYPDCENNLGNVLADLGQYTEAVQYYQQSARSLLRQTDQAVAYYNLANSLTALKRWQEAYNAYLESVKRRPDYVSAYNNMGNILGQFGHDDQALAAYQQALKIQPDFPICENNVGNLYMKTGHPDLALPYYQKVIKDDPQFASAYWGAGNANAMMNKLPDAVTLYTAALKLQPKFPEALANLGVALIRLGRPAEAIPPLEEALRLNPDFSAARDSLENARAQAAQLPSATPTP